MRVKARLTVGVTAEQMPALTAIYPEGRRYTGSIDWWLYTDDARFTAVMGALKDWGYTAWDHYGTQEYLKEYDLTLVREYESPDFAGVEYMEFWPELIDSVGHEDRDERGRLRLERPTLKNAKRAGLDLAHTILGHVLVLQPVRDLLLERDFRHLVFRPTVLVTGRGTRPGRYTPIPWEQFKVTPPWWELTSDLILPPLSATMDLRDERGNPIAPGDCSNGFIPREGYYNHAELHYRRSDLAQVEAFDMARTFENFGAKFHTDTRHTVVSKRFYDYCQEKGLRARWAPVRIDPD